MTKFPGQFVAIHSVPRSGSSWMGQIFKSSPHVEFRFQPLFSYAFKDYLGPDSSRERIFEFMEAIHASQDDFIHQRIKDFYVEYPDLGDRRDVTHLVWKEVRYHHILENLMAQVPELRLVGLVRHPCAVVDSWLHSPREFKAGWEVEKEWRDAPSKNLDRPEEFNGFTKWLEVAKLFMQLEQRYPDRCRIVRYAELNETPVEVTKELFAFCGLPFEKATEAFIGQSRSKEGSDANSVYRLAKPDDRWKTRLEPGIASAILTETSAAGLNQFLI